MSGDRLPTHMVVTALLRRVNETGGIGVVRARGDAAAGGVLAIVEDRGDGARVLERGLGGTGGMIDSTPAGSVEDYWRRRRAMDPDLWVVALDSPQAERFVAESIGGR